MEGLPQSIKLVAIPGNATSLASVVPLTRELARKQVDNWWALPGVSRSLREQENDHGWQWAKRIGELRHDRWHEAVAAVTNDDVVKAPYCIGLMRISLVDPSKPAVFVEAMATAPQNRPWLVKSAKYHGVGTGLLLRAVCHSYLLGYDGCVNLESFDEARTLKFYQNRGFEIIDRDDELFMLELPQNAVYSLLRKEGYDL